MIQIRKTEPQVLLLVPSFTARGGITNYYQALREYLPGSIEYLERGARNWPHRGGAVNVVSRLVRDYLKFLLVLSRRKPRIVHVNTAMSPASIKRDALYVYFSRILGISTVAFFRGWDRAYDKQLKMGKHAWFLKQFLSCDRLIVLSSYEFDKAKELGFKGNINQETTLVSDKLIASFSRKDLGLKLQKKFGEPWQILYLSRVEKTKGVFELVEALTILNSKVDFHINFAGDGNAIDELKSNIPDVLQSKVSFSGFVSGEAKFNLLSNADIFVLPSYTEGMPNSLLEAMAFGIPCLVTPVGGVPDVFKDGENGYILDSLLPDDIAAKFELLMSDIAKFKEIAQTNFEESRAKFPASIVAERLISIYNSI